MHLEIKQANDRTEQVSSMCIDKLYNLSKNGLLDATSDLRGSINAASAYEDAVTFLNTMWGPNLIVTASAYYIRFADPEAESLVKAALGKGQDEGVLSSELSSFRPNFKDNAVIQYFDEMKYCSPNVLQDAFYGCTNLKSIDLTNITHMSGNGNYFRGCINLEYFHGINGERGVLNLTKLNTASFTYWFSNCKKLERITSLGFISIIGNLAFSNCSALESVTGISSVTSIGSNAFENCSSLSTIDLQGITSIGANVFNACSNLEYCDGPNSTQGELNLPNLTGTLGNNAFKGCTKLTSITSLGSITSIGESTFENCGDLATINFPSTITSVGRNAFNNTAWYNRQPDGEVVIGSCLYKYKGTYIGTYTIPSNITSISPSCFYGQSSLTGIASWLSSQTTIPYACFQNSGLESFDLTGIVTIEGNAFINSKLTSIVIPNSITTLGNDCFSNCQSLTSITIGTGVTGLGRNIFSFCNSLETLVIPSNVKSLERDTLQNCTSLQWVRLESTTMVSLSNANCFNNTNNCIIYVPSDLVDTYKEDSKWSSLASRIQAIPTT